MPLISLIQQQVSKLTSKGYNAVHVSADDEVSIASVFGPASSVTHAFTTPEAMVKRIIPYLASNPDPPLTCISGISHLFIDESHCVAKW